ncbi:hypothetical protein G6L63_10010 [Agrobacterium vitis]|uniref:Uncharacterized protein n=1 Tax=Agrobacterium vitis TaxID=373 RepID=A0A368NEM5_AGRVI|nr:hypothetical protein [Agrobacterium vitis]KAA3512747.1 hypothetical protein DXM22_16055 [Agrobacterium vitis]KAA3526164.1 hypothetical protein DXT89_16730 [Agrobacterium vitis]MCF1478098.1 hypothetical protein [Agrobacterium vitis]MUZ99321.1 hypothetical protein [Agrobacterium vitis]MVA32840.1 hypothetical protein [Agrobacterium vitis]
MAEHLKTVKGRFLISLNDCEGVREVFKDFQFATVEPTLYGAGLHGKDVGVVVVMGGKDLPLA